VTHVHFSSDPQGKSVTEDHEFSEIDGRLGLGSPQSTPSGVSTPSSEQTATGPVLKAVAQRLSFWNKISNRDLPVTQRLGLPTIFNSGQPETLDRLIDEAKDEPAGVINTILATTAPPPTTTEQQHSEIEDKVIRECIREFTKGDMYFSYTFGTTLDGLYMSNPC
jgi:hypothetical protein